MIEIHFQTLGHIIFIATLSLDLIIFNSDNINMVSTHSQTHVERATKSSVGCVPVPPRGLQALHQI